MAVKAAGTEKCGVEDVRTVGRSDDDDSLLGIEAVHFHKELVERLLALVVPAAHAVATVATDRVNLINENQAGRMLFPLLEHVADAGCADPDEHFHEVRSGDGKEGHIRLTCDRAGEEGFSGSG